jgi:hypothetical protein
MRLRCLLVGVPIPACLAAETTFLSTALLVMTAPTTPPAKMNAKASLHSALVRTICASYDRYAERELIVDTIHKLLIELSDAEFVCSISQEGAFTLVNRSLGTIAAALTKMLDWPRTEENYQYVLGVFKAQAARGEWTGKLVPAVLYAMEMCVELILMYKKEFPTPLTKLEFTPPQT